jgi:hypothetical protein
MPSKNEELIKEIRASLTAELEEWLGFDIPDEGEDDYDVWQERLAAIEAIENVEDVIAYAEGFVSDSDEFLRKWGLAD